MKRFLVAALCATASFQFAPAAEAVCVYSRNGSIHVTTQSCTTGFLVDLCTNFGICEEIVICVPCIVQADESTSARES